MNPRRARVLIGVGFAGLAAALLLPACASRVVDSGRRLARVHGLVRHLHVELPSLGLVTGMRAAPGGGVLAAGPGGAVRVDAAGRVERLASAPGGESSTVQPLVLGQQVALVRRSPDGALTLFDAGGHVRVRAPKGAHDLAGGDLDGDGRLDLVAGLSKREGLRRMDSQGRARWTRSAVDPWEVELADTNGDGRAEIVHSNRQGAFVVRDADGAVRHSFETNQMARHFALVRWPDTRVRILQRSGDRIDLYAPEGEAVAHVETRVSNNHGPVDAVSFDPRGDGERWLAVLDRLHGHAPSVLSVFDARGRPVHEEVFLEPCASIGVLDGARLLVGCEGRLWRYEPGRVDPNASLSVSQVRRSGDAFGPLGFGDSPARVRALSTLLPGHTCRLRACESSYVRLSERDFLLEPEFEDGGLSRVAVLALPEPLDSYAETRAAWRVLVDVVSDRLGRPQRGTRRFPGAGVVDATSPQAGWRAYTTHRWSDGAVDVQLGVATLDDVGSVQYMAYATFSRRPVAPGL